jgi:hypothetical protein
MHINLNLLSQAAKGSALSLPTIHVRPQVSSPVVNNTESTVSISGAARRKASAEKAAVDQPAKDDPASELRALVKQYDFHNITPRQMANLAGELYKRGEISDVAEGGFIGVELNTEVAMDENKPIDMVAHFKRMLNNVEDAVQSDSALKDAVSFRRQDSKALADIMSFADSNRKHVTT